MRASIILAFVGAALVAATGAHGGDETQTVTSSQTITVTSCPGGGYHCPGHATSTVSTPEGVEAPSTTCTTEAVVVPTPPNATTSISVPATPEVPVTPEVSKCFLFPKTNKSKKFE